MKEEIIYAVISGNLLLRVIKVSPYIKDRQYSYGGAKLEILKVEQGEDGEEYEAIVEFPMGVEAALMVGNLLQGIAIECVAEMREAISMAMFATEALDKAVEEEERMYR